MRGTCTNPDTGKGTCGVPAPPLTLVRAPAEYLHLSWHWLALVLSVAGFLLRDYRSSFTRFETENEIYI